METFDVWLDRTITESGVGPGITDPATVRQLIALLEAAPAPRRSGAPAQLDAA